MIPPPLDADPKDGPLGAPRTHAELAALFSRRRLIEPDPEDVVPFPDDIAGADLKPPETRWCVRCGAVKLLDQEHFARRMGGSVFAHTCRDCGKLGQGRQVFPIQDGRDWS